METLENKYRQVKDTPGDINEHIPTLYEYAKQSNSVLECGVRSVISSWAFLKGLLENGSTEKKLISSDLNSSENISPFAEVAKKVGVNYEFIQGSDLLLDVDPVDIVFIDTWHIYGHLKRELVKFKDVAKKWIIMHDTTVDGINGESLRCGWDILKQSRESGYPVEEIAKGLWPAIEEFLKENHNFVLEKRYTNNNGLTILRKIEGSVWDHKPKIGILVLSSPFNNLYLQMKQIWQRYPKRDNISIFFLENYPDIEQTHLDGDTLKIKANEGFIPGILYKTMQGFNFFRDYDFDYILRTNISSFYVLDVLTETCMSLPKEKCYFGVTGFCEGTTYCSGAGFTVSKDLINLLADNCNLVDYKTIDDVAVGKFLIGQHGIRPIIAPREMFETKDDFYHLKEKIDKRCLHYRVKFYYEGRERYDLFTLEELFMAFYS